MKGNKLVLILAAVLCAYAWRVSQADPFIPTGTLNTGSDGDEASLAGQTSGLVYKQTSLMYIYVGIPDPNHLNDSSYDNISKAIFFPPIDKLSKLRIPGSYAAFVTNQSSPAGMYLWVNAFNLNSTRKGYLQRAGGQNNYAVGSYSLVVEMDKGVPKQLTWIDGCSECKCVLEAGSQTSESLSCPDAACVTENCAIPNDVCVRKGADTCDIKIYLAWVGTDARGRPATSAGSLPYNFLQFGLSPVYRAAAGVTDQYLFNLGNWGTKKPSS